MELEYARHTAEQVVRKLAPHCTRIKICGSIRRQKSECRDIDIVCQPILVPIKDLFGMVVRHMPCQGFIDQVNCWEKIIGEPTGRYTQRIVGDNIKLELSIARHENFGFLELIRTGSSDFSKKIAKRWVECGFNGVDGMFTKDGKIIIINDEHQIFDILGIPFIHPKDRT